MKEPEILVILKPFKQLQEELTLKEKVWELNG